MITTPSSISSLNRSFIIVWKVAGLLHRPKNITSGSKRPRLVRNAAFHSSPSRIRTLLYYVVVSPSHVQLGEILCTLHLAHDVRNKGKRVAISNGHGVELVIVLNEPKGSIFLFDEEHRSCHWRFRCANSPGFQI